MFKSSRMKGLFDRTVAKVSFCPHFSDFLIGQEVNMAIKPVFIPKNTPPFRTSWNAEYVYNGGFAVSQKQKNITAVHKAYTDSHPGKKVLEISSKSMQDGGSRLSAFHLMKFVPSLNKSLPVENVYQAGKVFKSGGPYTDLFSVSPRDAKRDERLRTSGPLTAFRFENLDFPLQPQTVFYDYLYINALLENEDLAKIILEYDAFTDIEFNPEKSINCQAKSAAMFVSLHRLNLLDKVKDPVDFMELFGAHSSPASSRPVPEPKPQEPSLSIGDSICHKLWGNGVIEEITGSSAAVQFPSAGRKKLGIDWILKNCQLL